MFLQSIGNHFFFFLLVHGWVELRTRSTRLKFHMKQFHLHLLCSSILRNCPFYIKFSCWKEVCLCHVCVVQRGFLLQLQGYVNLRKHLRRRSRTTVTPTELLFLPLLVSSIHSSECEASACVLALCGTWADPGQPRTLFLVTSHLLPAHASLTDCFNKGSCRCRSWWGERAAAEHESGLQFNGEGGQNSPGDLSEVWVRGQKNTFSSTCKIYSFTALVDIRADVCESFWGVLTQSLSVFQAECSHRTEYRPGHFF